MKSLLFNLFQVQENMIPLSAERSYGICIVNILKGIDLSVETVLSIFSTSIISRYARKSVNREQQIHVTAFRPFRFFIFLLMQASFQRRNKKARCYRTGLQVFAERGGFEPPWHF